MWPFKKKQTEQDIVLEAIDDLKQALEKIENEISDTDAIVVSIEQVD